MSIGRNEIYHIKNIFNKNAISSLRDFYKKNECLNNETTSIREELAVKRGESSDSLRLRSEWYDLWRTISPESLKFFGAHKYVMFPPQIRKIRSLENNVPWHQDIGYMRRLGVAAPLEIITCFVPLDEFPYMNTTLQFIELLDSRELSHMPLDGFGAGLEIDELQHKTKTYDLNSGDALIFGDLVVHRTFTPKGKNPNRLSVEFRLLTDEYLKTNKDYYDISSNTFIHLY